MLLKRRYNNEFFSILSQHRVLKPIMFTDSFHMMGFFCFFGVHIKKKKKSVNNNYYPIRSLSFRVDSNSKVAEAAYIRFVRVSVNTVD